jgi:hypothetical protein
MSIVKTNVLFVFGQFLLDAFTRWLSPHSFATKPMFANENNCYAGWPTETNDNWHETSTDYIWHSSPVNEWEASSLPAEWVDFVPDTTLTKRLFRQTQKQHRMREFQQISGLAS